MKSVPAVSSTIKQRVILPHLPTRNIQPGDGEEVGLSLQLIEKLFPAWIIILFDEQRQVQFVSANAATFFGVDPAALRKRSCSTFYASIHPDDKEAVTRICQRAEELVKQLAPEEVQEYRFILNYRYRSADGQFKLIHEETIYLLNTHKEYNIFTVIKDVTGEKPFTRVYLEWYKMINGSYRRLGSYVPTTENASITQRENEILQLIKEGLSSKEIADRLFISLNTVRNHRSNLFKKTHAKNMVELLKHTAAEEPVSC
jgi:DNA-binding CsgD family transcriptional regulator